MSYADTLSAILSMGKIMKTTLPPKQPAKNFALGCDGVNLPLSWIIEHWTQSCQSFRNQFDLISKIH